MEAAIKCIYKLSRSSKLIYKAALKGKRLFIIACIYMLNLVAVIPSSIDTIAINTKTPNMLEKDKEEYSYVTVFNDIKSTPKDIYLDLN